MGYELDYQRLLRQITNDIEAAQVDPEGSERGSSDARRIIERLWEERRLQRELSEFDFEDLDEE